MIEEAYIPAHFVNLLHAREGQWSKAARLLGLSGTGLRSAALKSRVHRTWELAAEQILAEPKVEIREVAVPVPSTIRIVIAKCPDEGKANALVLVLRAMGVPYDLVEI